MATSVLEPLVPLTPAAKGRQFALESEHDGFVAAMAFAGGTQ